MAELHLKGYITSDSDGIVALSDNDPNVEESWMIRKISIIDSIESFAEINGYTRRHNKGLGGRKATIDDCNIRAYFTDKECELEEAMLALDCLIYGGDINTKASYIGYSEWTITGLDLEEFSIGGHDLTYEFESHSGKYTHIIVEC